MFLYIGFTLDIHALETQTHLLKEIANKKILAQVQAYRYLAIYILHVCTYINREMCIIIKTDVV